MTHKIVAVKCSYARGKLVLTSIGESPRGTKVLLRKESLPKYDPRLPADRQAARAALTKLLTPTPE